ncbi:hypothetical protein BT69DRAFT_1377020, partial [Atractiella rhizophila]
EGRPWNHSNSDSRTKTKNIEVFTRRQIRCEFCHALLEHTSKKRKSPIKIEAIEATRNIDPYHYKLPPIRSSSTQTTVVTGLSFSMSQHRGGELDAKQTAQCSADVGEKICSRAILDQICKSLISGDQVPKAKALTVEICPHVTRTILSYIPVPRNVKEQNKTDFSTVLVFMMGNEIEKYQLLVLRLQYAYSPGHPDTAITQTTQITRSSLQIQFSPVLHSSSAVAMMLDWMGLCMELHFDGLRIRVNHVRILKWKLKPTA